MVTILLRSELPAKAEGDGISDGLAQEECHAGGFTQGNPEPGVGEKDGQHLRDGGHQEEGGNRG